MVLIIIFVITNTSVFGDTKKVDPINPFSKNYVSLEVAGNFPISRSQNLFSPHKKTWILGYSHFLNRKWNVSISLGFKSLYRNSENQELALLSLSNHSLYVVRLYHPTYLMVGTKLIYMTPNEKSRFPLVKEPDFETEIGVGAVAQLVHFQGPFLYSLRIDRWRGTKTNRLHGFEVAFGVSYRLKK